MTFPQHKALIAGQSLFVSLDMGEVVIAIPV